MRLPSDEGCSVGHIAKWLKDDVSKVCASSRERVDFYSCNEGINI